MMKLFLSLLISLIIATPSFAFDYESGGQLRIFSSASFYGTDHIASLYGPSDPYYDTAVDFRLKSSIYLTDHLNFSVHYQAQGSKGDSSNMLQHLPDEYHSFFSANDSDETKLFDLSSDSTQDNGLYFQHRLDRLYIKYSGDSSSLSLGRQAISTGSGLIFNPMDLVNPFSPSDVIRDYKNGTDMAVFQFSKSWISDGTLIYVPRRNEAGHIDMDASSIAVKLKTSWNDKEAGLFYARHYTDDVTGISFAGFLGSAAWRSDILWTQPDTHCVSGYASAILNLDYSWVAYQKNWYGLIECYYSGIGEQDVTQAYRKPALIQRISRGDLYNTATRYLGLQIRNEIHPLVNLSCTAIINLDDHSSLVQPTVKWNATQSIDILIGVDLTFGHQNTEFKGMTDPLTQKNMGAAQRLYIQGTCYF